MDIQLNLFSIPLVFITIGRFKAISASLPHNYLVILNFGLWNCLNWALVYKLNPKETKFPRQIQWIFSLIFFSGLQLKINLHSQYRLNTKPVHQ